MRRSKRQGHAQPDTSLSITWRDEPPSASQLVAWRRLWDRLLSHAALGQKGEPQEQDPGATTATVASGAPLERA